MRSLSAEKEKPLSLPVLCSKPDIRTCFPIVSNTYLLNYVSNHVNWNKIILGRETVFDVHVIFDIVGFIYLFFDVGAWHQPQKRHLWNMIPTKCRGQNDRMWLPVISCVYQNLDFSIGFATQVLMFTIPPSLRLIFLINLFCRRYVSCIYNISDISNISTV